MPGKKSPGPSIKAPRIYEALRREKMPKSQAAAISNATFNKMQASKKGKSGP